MDTIKSRIIKAAQNLGFDAVGISKVQTAKYGDYFDQWLADEKHGDMDWLARNPERRKNVQKLLPEAKSIIVVALNYFVNGPSPAKTGGNQGVVARYARGNDYHDLMQKMLKEFACMIKEIGGDGIKARVAVDTSAVLEREFAQRAGLAWVGKSTMALNHHLGTWFFLGEIITNLEIEAGTEATDHCGKCTRCIDACPTEAITQPYRLDARKCIAYLTIESKGDIPEEYRSKIGNRIFGCDDCLTVCPWNRFAKEAHAFKEVYRQDLEELFPQEILQMQKADFTKRFSKTPIQRLGLERLQRNAAVVLGNMGGEADRGFLNKIAVDHPSDMVRRHARWACQEIKKRMDGIQE